MTDTGNLFVVSAPSGAGKTSLVKALVTSEQGIGVAVSHTTRQKRPDEVDGENYHFIEESRFRSMVADDEFLEWATVFDHLYGTSISAVNEVLDTGRHLILEIDWQGAQQIRVKLPETRSIFIFPPSMQALQDRLENRAQDDSKTVARRMAAALEELSHWHEFDYLIVNDSFDNALSDLTRIVHGQGDELTLDARREALKDLIGDLIPAEQP